MQWTYAATLRELETASASLRDALSALELVTADVRRQVEAGVSLHTTLQPAHWEIRARVDDTWNAFQHAVHRARCEGVALIIDEGGLTITEFARQRGLSRQLISKLYKDAHNGSNARLDRT